MAILANAVATAAGPAIVASHPLWLLVLDARNRHLALAVGAGVSAVPFFAIGIARGLVFDPLFFLLARHHGEEATRWLAGTSPRSARMLGTAQSLFDRAGALVLFASPNYAVCLVAGQSQMSWRRFIVIDTLSTVLQVSTVWVLGMRFREPLGLLVGYAGAQAVPLTAASTSIVAMAMFRNRRRRCRAVAKLDGGVAK